MTAPKSNIINTKECQDNHEESNEENGGDEVVTDRQEKTMGEDDEDEDEEYDEEEEEDGGSGPGTGTGSENPATAIVMS